jgi:hypothetical protein
MDFHNMTRNQEVNTLGSSAAYDGFTMHQIAHMPTPDIGEQNQVDIGLKLS